VILARLAARVAPMELAGEPGLPFEDVLRPLARAAREILEEEDRGKRLALFSTEARLHLEERLVERLVGVFMRTLLAELDALRSRPALPGSPPDLRHRTLVAGLIDDRFQILFTRFPELGRLVASVVSDWISAALELGERLASDVPEISRAFSLTDPRVAALGPERSDPHHHGRSVTTLVFARGTKLLYKCRSLGMESALAELLAWLAEAGGAVCQLAAARVVTRDAYGWQEYVEALPASGPAAADLFYRRAGMLIAVLHVLSATDCHSENLVARGDEPVLVDAETLFQPDAFETPAGATLEERFRRSVLRTNALPHWAEDADTSETWQAGGFDEPPRGVLMELEPRWIDLGTDAMRLELVPVPRNYSHLPRVDGRPRGPGEHLGALREGFSAAHRLLQRLSPRLLDEAGPLRRFAGLATRVVIRPTAEYKALLRRSLEPDRLRDPVLRRAVLEELGNSGERAATGAARSAEMDALERLDVPYATARTETTELRVEDVAVPNVFAESAFARVEKLVASLDDRDLTWQLSLLDGAVYASAASPCGGNAASIEVSGETSSAAAPELLEEAERIAARLEAAAHREPDGSVTWMGFAALPRSGRFQHLPMGDGLEEGRAGVAVFLATLDELRARTTHRGTVLGALEPARRAIRRARRGDPPDLPASVVYALARVARSLGEPPILEEALYAADLHLPGSRADADTILALLALHRATGEAWTLERARRAGCMATANLPASGGARTAYALARLHEALHDSTYLDAARRAFEAEPGAPLGAAGGSSRGVKALALAASGVLDAAAARGLAEATLAATSWPRAGSLCCGAMGALELELVASDVLGASGLRTVRERLGNWIARSAARGGFEVLEGVPPSVVLPGLFHGESGVGFQLLRGSAPERVPSLLLWQ
jgi:type 2 lantibiotic biosynthesis protein LanM